MEKEIRRTNVPFLEIIFKGEMKRIVNAEKCGIEVATDALKIHRGSIIVSGLHER